MVNTVLAALVYTAHSIIHDAGLRCLVVQSYILRKVALIAIESSHATSSQSLGVSHVDCI